jgi:hypothetical protein
MGHDTFGGDYMDKAGIEDNDRDDTDDEEVTGYEEEED